MIISIILVAGVLYWYLNYQLPKTTPTPSVEKVEKAKKAEGVKEAIEEANETEEAGAEGIKTIPLEKPPFIK